MGTYPTCRRPQHRRRNEDDIVGCIPPTHLPVLIPLNLWREKSGNKAEGWLFPNGKGKPVDLRSLVARTIVPTFEAKKIEWKTLYAGRRGAATILTQLTGDALAAKELLRHKTIAVTTDKYVKAIPEALLKGIKLLEAAASGDGHGSKT